MLSTTFCPSREKNTNEFRGAARGVTVSSLICSNCLKFSQIYYCLLPFAPVFRDPATETRVIWFICTKGHKKAWHLYSSALYWRRRAKIHRRLAPQPQTALIFICTTAQNSRCLTTGAPAPIPWGDLVFCTKYRKYKFAPLLKTIVDILLAPPRQICQGAGAVSRETWWSVSRETWWNKLSQRNYLVDVRHIRIR